MLHYAFYSLKDIRKLCQEEGHMQVPSNQISILFILLRLIVQVIMMYCK